MKSPCAITSRSPPFLIAPKFGASRTALALLHRARVRSWRHCERLRYPLLKRMQEQLRSEVSALKLPRGISIDLPQELGSDELTVSLRVRTGAELAHKLEALDQRRAGLTRIIEMLGGKKMNFDLDAVFVEDGCADSALATRVLRALPRDLPVTHVADAREASPSHLRCARSVRRRQAPPRNRAPQDSISDAVSRRFLEVCVLRISRAHARFELPDGLLVLLSAGISRRQSGVPVIRELHRFLR